KHDHERDIIDKGRLRATQIAQDLAKELTLTEHAKVIASTANRAKQTAELFCDILRCPAEKIQSTKSIYEAFDFDILRSINKVGGDGDTLSVFGHNPGLSELTNYLADCYRDLKATHVAVITLEEGIDFAALSGSTAKLSHILI